MLGDRQPDKSPIASDGARHPGDARLVREQDRERQPIPEGYSSILMPKLTRGYGQLYSEVELEAEATEFFGRLSEQGARIIGTMTVHVRETGQTDRTLYLVEKRSESVIANSPSSVKA